MSEEKNQELETNEEKIKKTNSKEKVSQEKKENIKKKKSPRKKKNSVPSLFKSIKSVIALVVVIAIVIVVVLLVINGNRKSKLTTISKSTLQEVIDINELQTVDYDYNAVATQYDDNNEPIYYVAYDGTVTAGIDFKEIEISVEENDKKVVITLPEVEVQGTKIDMGTLQYIFTKGKYETEDVTQEAYKLCKEDLKNRIDKDKEKVLFETARENAVSSVEALFKPFIETVDSSYTLEIK